MADTKFTQEWIVNKTGYGKLGWICKGFTWHWSFFSCKCAVSM